MTPSLDQEAAPAVAADWWRQATVYQIYPRSFADADGDGIGDLRGIRSRVDYLAELGVDAVWLSPFYPSALADGGYDVDDYRDVDPRLGSLDDFDAMVVALHGAGIRVIVDIVPNHTGSGHEWFREALRTPAGSSARERYIFRDGRGAAAEDPPSDWTSIFGGPAWTAVGDGQWYLHSFASEQPDLNWSHPDVRADFLRTLRFWSDRGVDGFRVDVAQGLSKDVPRDGIRSRAEIDAAARDGVRLLWDRDDVHEIYAQWRTVFDEYDPPRSAVAEAIVPPERRARYASATGLGQAFSFDLLEADFDPDSFRSVIDTNLDIAARSGSTTTWVLSNHDVIRHATRYGLPPRAGAREKHGNDWLLRGGRFDEVDHERGLDRALAATLLALALPGSAYLYQGEELGLPEVGDIPAAERRDPAVLRNPGVDAGRDGCRVPLPWSRTGPSMGFGTGSCRPPQPRWFEQYCVEVQEAAPDSTLKLYRRALALRRTLRTDEGLEWLPSGRPDVLIFRRPNGWVNVTSFGDEPFRLPAGEVVLASVRVRDRTLTGVGSAWLIA